MLNIFSNKTQTRYHTHLFVQHSFCIFLQSVCGLAADCHSVSPGVCFLIEWWGETTGGQKKWPFFVFITMTMYVKWAADQAEYQNVTWAPKWILLNIEGFHIKSSFKIFSFLLWKLINVTKVSSQMKNTRGTALSQRYWMCEGIISVVWSWSLSLCHMTSARLSLTLLLCFVLALKAAELKRCCREIKRGETQMTTQNDGRQKERGLQDYSLLQIKTSRVAFTFSNLEILLPLTAVSRMSGGPRPKISLSRELNYRKKKTLITHG